MTAHSGHGNEGERPGLFPWAYPAEAVMSVLKSKAAGLTEENALIRLREIGPNEFRKERRADTATIFLSQFTSPLIFVLLGAAVITIILREWIETVVIFLAVFVNAALGFYQEYHAENTLERLTAYIKDRARVIRAGDEHEIDSALLVPGDIVRLTLGARVPADMRLIEITAYAEDEAFLTGESLPVKKSLEVVSEGAAVTEQANLAFAGSLVVEGMALGIVVRTGEDTEIGRIAKMVTETKDERTPLQKSLSSLAWIIFAGVTVIVTGLFALGISRGEPILEMLLLSAATAVGAIPEALPIALTVILAIGVERIAAKKGILRSLAAAETLGSTTVVMTDKTGTLTQAKMRITGVLTSRALLAGEAHVVTHANKLSPEQKSILSDALLATETVIENPDDPMDEWRLIGRALEKNIGLEALAAGIDVLAITRDRRIPLLPFNSTHKFSLSHDKKAQHSIALGAPDILLARSELSKDDYLKIEKRIQELSEEGKRLVGVARLVGVHAHTEKKKHDDVRNMEFLGVLVLYDPIRVEAAEAVRRIEEHGASVVMLTGDLKGTGIAIARELGWEIDESMVMTGDEVRRFSDEALSARLSDIRIFARVTPEDKLRIGKLYQAQGEVVAMTGDGVNDAPSLKAVDIGIALGSGSDVAKSVADLVLLNDNFKTIVHAIEEGRRIISNIRKAFVYLLSNCLDEVFLIGGSLLIGLPLPLTAMQIIWVNFFTGSLPALSYAYEENRDVGHDTRGGIFNWEVRVLTLGIGVLTSALLFAMYWGLLQIGVEFAVARTVLFLCFSTYILAVSFSFKSLHRPLFDYPLFDNTVLNLGLLIALVLVILSMALPFLRTVLDLVPIPLYWTGFVLMWLGLNLAMIEVTKWLFRFFR